MWEIVRFCRERAILCQGRGSAANSAVCYCLGITAVDPVRMGLLFERFLSRERAEPPDIDLDIEHERREEVIQHVYEKYGRDHAAMVANVIRYRARSAVRDVGKALGLPETALDRLAKLLPAPDEDRPRRASRQAGLDPDAPAHRHLLRAGQRDLRLPAPPLDPPRRVPAGPRAGDTTSSRSRTPRCRTAPSSSGTRTTWRRSACSRSISWASARSAQLDRCLRLIEEHRGVACSMATIPPDDPATFDMICRADTVGVFQIESRAQMAMLPAPRARSTSTTSSSR